MTDDIRARNRAVIASYIRDLTGKNEQDPGVIQWSEYCADDILGSLQLEQLYARNDELERMFAADPVSRLDELGKRVIAVHEEIAEIEQLRSENSALKTELCGIREFHDKMFAEQKAELVALREQVLLAQALWLRFAHLIDNGTITDAKSGKLYREYNDSCSALAARYDKEPK